MVFVNGVYVGVGADEGVGATEGVEAEVGSHVASSSLITVSRGYFP